MNSHQMPRDRLLQINSHQYSVASFVRDVSQRAHVTNEEGVEMTHGLDAMPGTPSSSLTPHLLIMYNQGCLSPSKCRQ